MEKSQIETLALSEIESQTFAALQGGILGVKAQLYDLLQQVEQTRVQLTGAQSVMAGAVTAAMRQRGISGRYSVSSDLKRLVEMEGDQQ